eukprot:9651831-Alexandrium_andersonii.AAC.1
MDWYAQCDCEAPGSLFVVSPHGVVVAQQWWPGLPRRVSDEWLSPAHTATAWLGRAGPGVREHVRGAAL